MSAKVNKKTQSPLHKKSSQPSDNKQLQDKLLQQDLRIQELENQLKQLSEQKYEAFKQLYEQRQKYKNIKLQYQKEIKVVMDSISEIETVVKLKEKQICQSVKNAQYLIKQIQHPSVSIIQQHLKELEGCLGNIDLQNVDTQQQVVDQYKEALENMKGQNKMMREKFDIMLDQHQKHVNQLLEENKSLKESQGILTKSQLIHNPQQQNGKLLNAAQSRQIIKHEGEHQNEQLIRNKLQVESLKEDINHLESEIARMLQSVS